MTSLKTLFENIGIPLAYRVFPKNKEQTPPFAVYYRNDEEHEYADDTIYSTFTLCTLEVYVTSRDETLEWQIKKIFEENDIVYEFSETYIDSERLTMLSYEFYILEE